MKKAADGSSWSAGGGSGVAVKLVSSGNAVEQMAKLAVQLTAKAKQAGKAAGSNSARHVRRLRTARWAGDVDDE